MEKNCSGVTFKLNDKACIKSPHLDENGITHRIEGLDIFTDFNGRYVKHFNKKPNTFNPQCKNGFIGTIFEAYCNHYNLAIRPDDVWIAIIMAFANYVSVRAEKLRSKFVNHDGKMNISVEVDANSPEEINWESAINEIATMVDKHTKQELKDWCITKFSTTTEMDELVSGIALLGAIKHYFHYEDVCCCGIPSITLEGTLKDWKDIKKRVGKLKYFGMIEWCELLEPILDQFIAAFEGQVDKRFWNSICYGKTILGPRDEDGFEDDYEPDQTHLSGWILAFAPFNDKGKYALNKKHEILKTGKYGEIEIKDIPLCAIDLPIDIITLQGDTLKYILFGGIFQGLWNDDLKQVRPSVDYLIIDDTNSEICQGFPAEDIQKDKYGNFVIDSDGRAQLKGKNKINDRSFSRNSISTSSSSSRNKSDLIYFNSSFI